MYINKISVYQNNVYARNFSAKRDCKVSFKSLKGSLAGGVASYIIAMGLLNISNSEAENSIMPLIASTAIGAYCGSKMDDKNNDDDDNNDNSFNKRMRRI